jgi:hypothetical protein
MLDNIHAVELSAGHVPQLHRKPRARATSVPRMDVQRWPALAVAIALELAQGDSTRLELMADGSVMVTNSPRRATRTKEAHR